MEIFGAALAAADPYKAVMNSLTLVNSQLHISDVVYDLNAYKRIMVVGAGKATARMALAMENLLGDRINVGLIVVKDGHTEKLTLIEQIESSHPVPGEDGVNASRRIMELMREADEKTLIICLLSGGASALMVLPVNALSLQDKQETTRLLLNAGASIAELNAVRKHLSLIKGGGLAQAACPAQMITLIVSDVVGDRMDVIASGPTTPDTSTFAEAWSVIEKYDLVEKLPQPVRDYLRDGISGKHIESVKVNNPCVEHSRNIIVASNKQALQAAKSKAIKMGFQTLVIADSLQGEAREVATLLAQKARSEIAKMEPKARRCLLWGGETTVTVKGSGKGGRNQELALAFAMQIEGVHGITFMSAGTDGSDGPTDAAGAMVDGETVLHARSAGMDAMNYLERNDAYSFFKRLDEITASRSHLILGPTGTNVMDIQIALLNLEDA